MSKIAINLQAEPGTNDALGRALHAFMFSKELNDERGMACSSFLMEGARNESRSLVKNTK